MSFWKPKRCTQSPPGGTADECQCRKVRINTSEGLQLRAAAALSSVAGDYRCKVRVRFKHREADATSILALLCLSAGAGSELTLEAVGPDSVEALDRIEHLIHHGFDVRA